MALSEGRSDARMEENASANIKNILILHLDATHPCGKNEGVA